jgi:anti-sigma B factor antagonist
MSSAKLTIRQKGDVTIVDVGGRLTPSEGSGALRDAFRELVETGSKRILLNMAAITEFDSSGIGELVVGYTSIARAGGTMKLLNANKRLKTFLKVTRLCEVFETQEDEESAVRSFSAFETAARLAPGTEYFLG